MSVSMFSSYKWVSGLLTLSVRNITSGTYGRGNFHGNIPQTWVKLGYRPTTWRFAAQYPNLHIIKISSFNRRVGQNCKILLRVSEFNKRATSL